MIFGQVDLMQTNDYRNTSPSLPPGGISGVDDRSLELSLSSLLDVYIGKLCFTAVRSTYSPGIHMISASTKLDARSVPVRRLLGACLYV